MVINAPFMEHAGITGAFVEIFSATAGQQSNMARAGLWERGPFAVKPKIAPYAALPEKVIARPEERAQTFRG
ncbi:MAG: hypothetical protein IOC82_06820 [Aestuariivirga sp.]|uniref:hypothetical protein n=1 Tax=Aestuariivirga sp. TaxID=2650926 RepID=UPI0025C63CB3|nr:hypothetical protein [Aestuariivirga sp.]MCA3560727.1 hypothetical protein [Aestuariivirga sp.]